MEPVRDNPVMEKPKIIFTPQAYAKMSTLIMYADGEIGWHGTVIRDGDKFTITDILLFEQEVSAATVTPEQKKYEQFLDSLSDEQFKSLRFHGHSHVNMGTSPSGTDIGFWEKMIGQIPKNQFYIFMIWNKKLDTTIRLYDEATKIVYYKHNIDLYVGDTLLEDIFKEVNTKVSKHSYYPVSNSIVTGYYTKGVTK